MKKFGGLFGLVLGFLSIFGAFFIEGGTFSALFLVPAILVVFGGTFAAVIIGFGYENFSRIFLLARIAYFSESYDIKELINRFVQIAVKVRRDGLLSIEPEVERIGHRYPRKMLHLLMDGTDFDNLEAIAFFEIKAMDERHSSNAGIFAKMGGYAPTMGILGTVMGLIMTLANAGRDPNLLIHSIATAFIATLWGVLSANLIWFPIADRLRQCHLREKHLMNLTLEAVLCLQKGEIPSLMRQRLLSMLPSGDQEDY